jgi:biopolymer transport protein ExbD
VKVQRKRRLRPILPVTSMGDIAFLLIIFFILTSNFMKELQISMTPASSRDVERLKQEVISVSVDHAGQVWLQGKPCEVMGLEGAINELKKGTPGETVMVKIDKEVPHQKYGEVLLALSRAEIEIALVGDRLAAGN